MDEGGREREGGSARERENAGPRPGPRLWTFFPNNKVPLVENLHIRVTIQVIEPRRNDKQFLQRPQHTVALPLIPIYRSEQRGAGSGSRGCGR